MSPSLDPARDCSRFTVTFSDTIGMSPSHIYISALLKPHGPQSLQAIRATLSEGRAWVANLVGTSCRDRGRCRFCGDVWSPCNRFIAVTKPEAVEIRDAVTLALLNTSECPSSRDRPLNFSPDSRFLARFASGICISRDL